jgi:tetratricopeptide (TPR) repeat protein
MQKLLTLLFIFLYSQVSFSQRGIEVINQKDSIGNNYALVVGISNYNNVSRLLYASDDAELFSAYLVTENICPKSQVSKLLDSAGTKANFFKELKRILNHAQAHDRVFIFFAGHGDVETEIESGFLLCYNSEPNNYPATDAIDISMLERYVDALVNKKVKVVLITDACRSGNLAGGLAGALTTISSIDKGFHNVVKLLSCQPNQLSEERNYPGGGHGVFTYHLVEGLEGLADRDHDKQITLRELDLYLDEVSKETKNKQVPKVEGDPLASIATYSEAYLKVALLRKNDLETKSTAYIRKRRADDTSWRSNPFYQRFDSCIKRQAFTGGKTLNAYSILNEAIEAKQSEAMVDDMKLELSAVLENQVQKWINTYLHGELDQHDKTVLKQISQQRVYVQAVEALMGIQDFRYNEMRVREAFLDAYYQCRSNNKAAYLTSIRQLEKANQLMPNQAWILHLQAILYLRLHEAEKGIEKEKAALALSPHWAYAWLNLGDLQLSLGKYSQAEQCFQKSIGLDSTYTLAWNQLGDLLLYENKVDGAYSCFLKTLHLDSTNSRAWYNLAKLREVQNKTIEAESCYKQSIRFDSSFAEAWSNYGYLLYKQKRYAESTIAIKKALYLDSSYVFGWNNLGNLYLQEGHARQAEAAFLKCLSLDSTFIFAYNSLAFLHKSRNEFSVALPFLKKALVLNKAHQYDFVYYNAAALFAKMNQKARALYYLNLALKKGSITRCQIKSDPDFKDLQKEPSFAAITQGCAHHH